MKSEFMAGVLGSLFLYNLPTWMSGPPPLLPTDVFDAAEGIQR